MTVIKKQLKKLKMALKRYVKVILVIDFLRELTKFFFLCLHSSVGFWTPNLLIYLSLFSFITYLFKDLCISFLHD